ncbi:hypothetical protein [Muriicola soli]|uniref:Uncharacterized protein n=1 Tax=Muriicola soli TaxID=2507538 RepID=A0A411E8V7_9FLAO|nr:hypothetical protein [Muriicola soli]QBA64007.1 hypothetical protein EQY75_05320 [Muriicola soli]
MKYLFLLLILVNLNTCQQSSGEKAIIKKQRIKHYSAKTDPLTFDIRKDEIEFDFEIGYDNKGNQTYSINFLMNSKDTVWINAKNSERKMGDKICFYRDSTLLQCKLKRNDTLWIYHPPNIDKPASYELYDDQGLIGGIFPSMTGKFPYKKSFLSDRKFDERGNLIYYVNTEFYLPRDFDFGKIPAGKTNQENLVQAGRKKIIESDYEYYK